MRRSALEKLTWKPRTFAIPLPTSRSYLGIVPSEGQCDGTQETDILPEEEN